MPLFANFKKNSVHGAQSSLNLLKIEGGFGINYVFFIFFQFINIYTESDDSDLEVRVHKAVVLP